VFCARELPSAIEQVHREFKDQGFTILAVNMRESRDLVAKWVKEKEVTSSVLFDFDGAVTATYRVTATPTVVLVGRDGRLVGRAVGPRDWTGKKGRALIKALLTS
jgi:peroxiredoxin